MNRLRQIRLEELGHAVTVIPAGSRLLEIGAGSGWQAKALAESGYAVEAIDIPESCYAENRVWPVLDYDGRHIPFPNSTFDVVFTSNTLEHIANIGALQDEIRRVLKPNGIAVHIVPTGSWRFWTNLTHYLFVFRLGLGVLGFVSKPDDQSFLASARAKRSLWTLIVKTVFPPRHGERGNSISELWTFSRLSWLGLFKRTGWLVESYKPLRLFYTGHLMFDAHLPLCRRKRLSNTLGSATMMYLVRPRSNVFSNPEKK